MIYLGIGSNLPGSYASSEALVKQAIDRLGRARLRICAVSPLYRTQPIGPAGQDTYVNACLAISTNLSPEGLLRMLHAIEAEFGRARRVKWGPRTLDIDVLDYRGKILDQRMILPHPRIAQRGFVLVPLYDIAPNWRHPVTGVPIETLKKQLPIGETKAVRRL